MRPVRLVIPGAGETVPVPLDIYQKGPITISITNVGAGTVDIDVEFTTDDIYAPGYDPSTGNWFPCGAALTGAVGNVAVALVDADEHLIVPTAVRAVNDGADTALLTVIQSGIMG